MLMKKRGFAVFKPLLFCLPYLFISAAVVLLTLYCVDTVVMDNMYYRLLTNAPEISQDSQQYTGPKVIKTEEERAALQENNEGSFFGVRADFPAIFWGEQWATISIESIGLKDAPVFHGDNPEELWQGIGHYDNSRFPGQNGKVVLSGHVNTGDDSFEKLETMEVGADVVLNTIYGDYIYRVRETRIFDEKDPTLLMPEETDSGDVLICYTCYPYHTTSLRTQRFAIICDLISGEDWTKEAQNEAN